MTEDASDPQIAECQRCGQTAWNVHFPPDRCRVCGLPTEGTGDGAWAEGDRHPDKRDAARKQEILAAWKGWALLVGLALVGLAVMSVIYDASGIGQHQNTEQCRQAEQAYRDGEGSFSAFVGHCN